MKHLQESEEGEKNRTLENCDPRRGDQRQAGLQSCRKIWRSKYCYTEAEFYRILCKNFQREFPSAFDYGMRLPLQILHDWRCTLQRVILLNVL